MRSGVSADILAPMVLRELFRTSGAKVVVLPRIGDAEQLAAELTLWLREMEQNPRRMVWIPDPGTANRLNPDDEIRRTRLAHDWLESSIPLTLVTPQGLFSVVLPDSADSRAGRQIKVGDTLSMEALLSFLVELDYDDELEVNLPGEFARHGGILDLFSPADECPVRIEFFGNRVESIRRFSVVDQRSVGKAESVTVVGKTPPEAVEGDDFWDCMIPHSPQVIIVHPDECDAAFVRFGSPLRLDKWREFLHAPYLHFWEGLPDPAFVADSDALPADCFSLLETVRQLPPELGSALSPARRMIAENVRRYARSGYGVSAMFRDRRHTGAVERWIAEYDLSDCNIELLISKIPSGVVLESTRQVLLSEREIFFTPHRRTLLTPETESEPLPLSLSEGLPDHFAELDEGDYAVHLLHGIGRFLGVRQAELNGIVEEVLELEFDDEVKLFVPISQAGMVSRYSGTGKNAPKLSKLSGHRWEKLKHDALLSMKHLASDLLRLQAARSASEGLAFPPDSPEQSAFESEFPYRETPDQTRAIAETKQDMEAQKPMDRLICGDVGYGKTEVAVRAIFKAVQAGKQVAFLVPTTILAQQHYYTLCERFSEYPIVTEVLSRFRSPAEHKDVLRRLASGGVDVVVGTHRLIQPDVVFPNLGLVIVDEEQRFGVEHKERFKRMRTAVDVLTLSATPIPRTLYMSMTGLRDLSTLVTPPERRLPVETIVAKRDMLLITEAIRRELQRGGQIFFLHNRVRTIEKVCAELQRWVPEARFSIAHGQMAEGELEQVMAEFIDGKRDVLVCTTIIESGVDIPNANTLFVDDAHRFGLSELYQLRGRVGRWTRQAHAYLLLPGLEALSGDARKRMSAIRKYTQLGSGFRLAMRDLEIRGSGNLLGSEQSGHIANLGFDLYCRLLRETVSRLKREPVPILPEAEITVDFIRYALAAPSTVLCAGLSKSYIPSLRHRIDFYRQFAHAASDTMIDCLADEMRDRFGPLPEKARNLLDLTRLRLLASQAGFRAVREFEGRILLERGPDRYYRDENGALPILKGKTPREKLHGLILLLRGICASALCEMKGH